MLRSSIHIPERVLQVIGGAYLVAIGVGLVSGIVSGIRGGLREDETEVPLATTHPAVPTNLFSATLERENNPAFQAQRSNRWLQMFGDKVCHSTLSLLLHISQGAKLSGTNAESRKHLFALFLQGALAESRLELNAKAVSPRAGDALLNCVAVTILDSNLAGLDHYNRLLALPETARCNAVVKEAAQAIDASARVEKAFRAAYLLLRTMVRILICEMPR